MGLLLEHGIPPSPGLGAVPLGVLDRRVGLQVHAPVDPIEIDAGNDGTFLVDNRLPLHDGRQSDYLVYRHARFLGALAHLGRDPLVKGAQQKVDEASCVSVLTDLVRLGEEEPLQRAGAARGAIGQEGIIEFAGLGQGQELTLIGQALAGRELGDLL